MPTAATVRLVFTVFIVTFGTNFQIYNGAIVNNVQIILTDWLNSTFEHRYGYELDETSLNFYLGIASSIPQVGGFLGSMLTRLVTDSLGRRGGLILSSCINMVGAMLVGFGPAAQSYEMLVAGRLLLGVSMGLGFSISGMFLAEIPLVHHRGMAGSMQQVFVGFGDFLSLAITLPQLLGTEKLWPLAFGFPLIPSAIQLVFLTLFAHDTPRHLYVTKKDSTAAAKAIQFYQGESEVESTMAELKVELLTTNSRANGRPHVSELLRRSQLRQPFLIALAVMLAVASSGIGAVMTFSTDIFIEAGLEVQIAQYATVAVGFCNFVVPILSLLLIEKVGRRVLFFVLLYGDVVALMLLTLFTGLHHYNGCDWAKFPTIVCLLAFQCFFGLGSPISWIITSELFDTRTRALAISVINPICWSVSAAWIFLFLPFKELVGVSLSFVPFIVCLICAIFYLTGRLPETKGRTLAHIVASFGKNNPNLDADGNQDANGTQQPLIL